MAQPSGEWSHHPGTRELLFHEIVQALESMDPKLRELFVRSHYQGRSSGELARSLGMESQQLRERLREANRVFYRCLRRGPASEA